MAKLYIYHFYFYNFHFEKRYLDKLVDELAKGRKMEKILRDVKPNIIKK